MDFDAFFVAYLGVESDPDDAGRQLRKWKMEPKAENSEGGGGYLIWGKCKLVSAPLP